MNFHLIECLPQCKQLRGPQADRGQGFLYRGSGRLRATDARAAGGEVQAHGRRAASTTGIRTVLQMQQGLDPRGAQVLTPKPGALRSPSLQ